MASVLYQSRDAAPRASPSRSQDVPSEPTMQMAPGTPAPYGQACHGCVQVKCKCITRLGGGCERCHRLKKECRRSGTNRRKNARKVAAPNAVQLQEKLDSIVSLLKYGAQPGPIPIQVNAPASWDVSSSDDYTLASSNASSYSPPAVSSNSSYDNSSGPDTSEPSALEAEEYLNIFRMQRSKFLPFVHIPTTTLAAELHQERPFLWLCIMAISAKSTTQQMALSSKVRLMLSRKMLLELETDLDLLLGLLTFIGWANCHVQRKQSLSIFTQMAVSLVFDLGLNKPAGSSSREMSNLYAYGCPQPPKSTVRTMEERRAVLGCFLISSVASSFLQRIDALRWTPHMDECLETLAQSKECLTDNILVQQVRLQLIVEKVVQVPLHNGEASTAEPVRVPPALYVRALQSQLQEVKDNITTESQPNEVGLLHLHSTALTINEIGFSKLPVISNYSDFQQLEGLYASLNSIKSWFDVFLAIPPAAYIGFPFSIFSQLIHCLMALFKLSTLEDPAWDKGLVRSTADVLFILNQVVTNMQQVNHWLVAQDKDNTEGNIFAKGAEAFETIKARWQVKLAAPLMGPAYLATPDADREIGTSSLITQNVDEVMGQFTMDLPENWWFSDVFASWDC